MKRPWTLLSFVVGVFLLGAGCAPVGRQVPSTPSVGCLKQERFPGSTNSKVDAEYLNALQTFDQACVMIRQHYIEKKDLDELMLPAIQGMEEWLVSENKTFMQPSLGHQDMTGDKDRHVKTFLLAFESFHRTSGTAPTQLAHAAIKGMMKELDPHNSFMSADLYKEAQDYTKGQFSGIGLRTAMKNDRVTVLAPIDESPAKKVGIQKGDRILKINEEPTARLTLREVDHLLRGPIGSKLTLTLEREGVPAPLVFDLVRKWGKAESVQAKVIDENIGYIRLHEFRESTPQNLNRALRSFRAQNIQGLILDLQDNPGGLLVASVGVVEQFLEPDKLVVSIKARTGRIDEYRARLGHPPYEYPMVVLVNEGSAAASEIVAAAMQDWGKAVILGTQTIGQGTVQTVLPLSDGSALRLTVAEFYTPRGESIDSVGVKPDIVVEEQQGVDAPLARAKLLLKSGSAFRGLMKKGE